MSRRKQLRQILPLAREMGWAFDGYTARGHLRWKHVSGLKTVTAADLPLRTLKNSLAQLRRLSTVTKPDTRPNSCPCLSP